MLKETAQETETWGFPTDQKNMCVGIEVSMNSTDSLPMSDVELFF